MPRKKKPAQLRPVPAGDGRLEVRIRPEERDRVIAAAARTLGPDGRPLTVSAWARSVLLAAAEKA